ncbi:MAG: Rpn family recombination-promoting nuclease/putative transposase [Synergistaceae bacterium]|nr:Rpn family recombination-promoting nuclease/putative transposase [Synergistaceae bacterium]
MTEQGEERQNKEQKQSTRDVVLNRRLLDSLFKYVFCREERKDVFLDMVNAFVYPEGEGAFEELHFLDREKSPERKGGKGCRLDALARTSNETMIHAESQVNKKQYFSRRTFTYVSRVYNDQFNESKGEDKLKPIGYERAKPIISINLLGYTEFKDSEDYREDVSLKRKNGKNYIEDIRLIFLELTKFRKKFEETRCEPHTKQECWLAYLAGTGGKRMRQIAEREPMIQKALEAEKVFLADRKERLAYLQDWKIMMDEISDEAEKQKFEAEKRRFYAENHKEDEGKRRIDIEKHRAEAENEIVEAEKRIAEARVKTEREIRLEIERKLKAEQKARIETEQKAKVEMARKMLKAGMTLDTIAEISGIPVKDLEPLSPL